MPMLTKCVSNSLLMSWGSSGLKKQLSHCSLNIKQDHVHAGGQCSNNGILQQHQPNTSTMLISSSCSPSDLTSLSNNQRHINLKIANQYCMDSKLLPLPKPQRAKNVLQEMVVQDSKTVHDSNFAADNKFRICTIFCTDGSFGQSTSLSYGRMARIC